jgi:hypothetical protein
LAAITILDRVGAEKLTDQDARYHEWNQAWEMVVEFTDGLKRFGIETTLLCDEDTYVMLNPYDEELPEVIPSYFLSQQPAVVQIANYEDVHAPREHRYCLPIEDISLGPAERLLKIDVSQKKGDILEDISQFLNTVSERKRAAEAGDTPPWAETYVQWDTDVSRRREETWAALKVWKLRRQKKSFFTISKETGLLVPAAKKAFYRAYELIEGRKYDRAQYKDFHNEITTLEVKRTCKTCPERTTCTDPCPDVLAFIEQDEVKLRERSTLL